MGDERNPDVTVLCEILGSPEAPDPQGSAVQGLPHTRGQADRARSEFSTGKSTFDEPNLIDILGRILETGQLRFCDFHPTWVKKPYEQANLRHTFCITST